MKSEIETAPTQRRWNACAPTNSSHTTKHAELSKAIALLKVTQSECKFNAARKSAASVFLRLQWVGVALSGVAGIMRIHNSMH